MGVLVLEGLVVLHRTIQLQFLQHYWLGPRLGLPWYWIRFALETNRDHSAIFEIASKYCILNSFVEHDGYSMSSKGFLPTVVDIMVIWINFTHSSAFCWFPCWHSCLTTSNLPWFMDPTFWVPVQHCSSQHWTLLAHLLRNLHSVMLCWSKPGWEFHW